jgi:NAD(P)-dependent dehydrogenase (short-subunit alcohol dehydrogenase family)
VGQLDGKVVIVTGAAHGMGRSHARRCVAEGAHVVATDIQPIDGEVGSIGVRHDVSREQDWDAIIDSALSNFGRVDGLVNNAAVLHETCNLEDEDIETFRRTLEVNVVGTWWGIRKVIAPMRSAGGGSIVNISSIMGIVASEDSHPGYPASKAAVRNYTKAAACRYGPQGVRVNSVHPGYMPPMLNATNAAGRDAKIAQTPLRRLGKPIEVAYGVLFLASDEASFVTGTELVIDGGYIAH